MKQLWRGLALLFTVTATLPPTGRAFAQTESESDSYSVDDEEGPAEEAKKEAAHRYKQGVQAYSEGLYKDAIDLFLEADSLAPSPALSFNIARAYDKIHDNAGSLKYYRDYLRRLPGAEDKAVVEQLIAEREQQLEKKGVQQVTVLTHPKGATVVIDEQPVGVSPWTGELAPGEHALSLRLRGFLDTDRMFELTPDRAQELSVRLVPGKTAPPAVAPGASTKPGAVVPDARSASSKTEAATDLGIWPWVTLGVGAVTLVAAGTFEWRRRGSESEAKKSEQQLDFLNHYEAMEREQKLARILTGVGGGLLLTSGVLFLLDGGDGDSAESSPTLSAGCDLQGCLAAARGSF